MASVGREKVIGAMEMDIGGRVVRTFRGLLWFNGQKEGVPWDQAVSEVEKLIGNTLPGMRSSLTLTAHHGWEEFKVLYQDVEAVGRYVDGL